MAGRGPTEAQTQSQAVRLEVLIVHDWAQFPFVFLIRIVDLSYGEVQTVNTWATPFRPAWAVFCLLLANVRSPTLISDAEIATGSEW
jgi:hypothetical protein